MAKLSHHVVNIWMPTNALMTVYPTPQRKGHSHSHAEPRLSTPLCGAFTFWGTPVLSLTTNKSQLVCFQKFTLCQWETLEKCSLRNAVCRNQASYVLVFTITLVFELCLYVLGQLWNLIARFFRLLITNITFYYTLLKVMTGKGQQFGKHFYGKAAQRLCHQPFGAGGRCESQCLRSKPLSGSLTQTSSAQKGGAVSMIHAVTRARFFQKLPELPMIFIASCVKKRVKNGKPMGAWTHKVGGLYFCKYESKLDSFGHYSELCSRRKAGEENQVSESIQFFLEVEGQAEARENQGPEGYLQPWLVSFFLAQMGIWGITTVLISWKEVTCRGQRGQAPCDIGQQWEVW